MAHDGTTGSDADTICCEIPQAAGDDEPDTDTPAYGVGELPAADGGARRGASVTSAFNIRHPNADLPRETTGQRPGRRANFNDTPPPRR